MDSITLTIAGIERLYLLARPEGRSPSALVVALHGMGATAAWADDEANWSVDFPRLGFALAIPDALPPHPAKPPKFLTNPPRWNDGGIRGQGAGGSQNDVTFLTAVIEDVAHRTGLEPRACVTGFSNGAGMAFRLAAERPDLVTALAPVAGHCWVEDPKPSRPIPTLYMIGTADPLVPLEGGPVKAPWHERPVLRPTVAETLAKWATAISDPALLQVQLIEGHGHHWPGGKGQLSERIGGMKSDQVNANEVIGEFFRRHALTMS